MNYTSLVIEVGRLAGQLRDNKQQLLTIKQQTIMNIFAGLQVYAGKWAVVEDKTRSFNDEEKALIERAEVVASEYGNSVCFFMKGGGQTYIPLSNQSSLTVGDSVDISKAKLLTLHRDGSADITRIDI
jgi:hypothetical protein